MKGTFISLPGVLLTCSIPTPVEWKWVAGSVGYPREAYPKGKTTESPPEIFPVVLTSSLDHVHSS